jgi:hypothetical protein
MKTFIAILVPLLALTANAADVRIVNNVRVDLQPVHNWMKNHKGERPMKHWKQIKITSFTPGGPWPTCVMSIDGGGDKTVYLKNIPIVAIQYLNQRAYLESQIKTLSEQIAIDTKRLRSANAVQAEYGSEYDQNRDIFRANLQNRRDDLDELRDKLSELTAHEDKSLSDLAMFSGQVYNSMEVWDCGLKTQ